MSYTAKAKTVLLYAGALAALWLVLELLLGPAKADTHRVRLHVYRHVPTVPGIEAGPLAHPWYMRGPLVRRAPSPGVFHMDPAPANGCGAAFRVVSGPKAQRGCYGGP